MHLWLDSYVERPLFEEEQLVGLQRLINLYLPEWAVQLRIDRLEDSPDAYRLAPQESLYQAASEATPVRFGLSSFVIQGSYDGMMIIVHGSRAALPPELNCIAVEIVDTDYVEQQAAADWARSFFAQVPNHLPVRYANARLTEEFDAKNMLRTAEVTGAIGVNIDEAIPGLYWLNYFGIPYVKMMGRENLLSSPAYRVEALADGVLLELGENPADWTTTDYKEGERAVIDHVGRLFFFSRDEPDKKTVAPDFRSELRWR
jgi:hypothetical protein